ncbi:DEAD/DEAH box helicase [bacterium]|nr:DEAD/DEAH box helicase [bacterium]
MLSDLPFHPVIANWFSDNFGAPSPPQAQGWPVIAAGRHTLILAPTGSGKTLAAFLWCLDDLFRRGLQQPPKAFGRNAEGIHTLYVSPLKALNNDIHRNLQQPLHGIQEAGRASGLTPPAIRALVRTGDTPAGERQAMLRRPPHLLITTPESLYLLLTSRAGRELFRGLRYLIVDEIHAVSSNKRGVHLSLSLERLMPLCTAEPVRIGLSATQRPLERIAAFLGGQVFRPGEDRPQPRPVTIVDCGQRKEMDLQVISPVPDFGDLPDATVWYAVIDKLYELIHAHRTTLVFVNMRGQTERVARLLNEKHRDATGDPEAELALAHHGSLARERRYEIEARLKAGDIPAVIATASLELGIDIGSIDLVVQLESPRTVAAALQRVGRSGHLLHATSKGRLLPLYPADLDDAVTLARCMHAGDIEETVIPENCLDVLSQQLVAEVAMRDWSRLELYRLVCHSYCYRQLSLAMFDTVLEMLAGRYAEAPLRALQPRLTWDRINDRLIARRGARLLATLNAGTIPDRGYYAVYLADSNTKLGEMEEEFVFESRVHDVFYLGSSEWRIDAIERDRLIVSPVRAVRPRPPFWRGENLLRDYATSLKIGAFRRELIEHLDRGDSVAWLQQQGFTDAAIAANLADYFARQRDYTGAIANDREIVAEWYRDHAEESSLIVHAPFGSRVNGAWAIALCRVLEKRHQAEVQYTYNDDGIVLRLPDTGAPPALAELLQLPPEVIEQSLLETVSTSALFTTQFRYNASRALLLPRARAGKRVPLWLQRLRAADLLQVVREFPDFPILLETYRDCLQGIFDLPALRHVLSALQAQELRLHIAETARPSPMASGLLFRLTSENLYEFDRNRAPAQAAEVSSALLAEILAQETIPSLITPELVKALEARWQCLTPETQAASAEDLFVLIEKLGPLPEAELQRRSRDDISPWLAKLQQEKRIIALPAPLAGWIAATDAPLFHDPFTLANVRVLVQRLLRSRGPLPLIELAALSEPLPLGLLQHLPPELLQQALAQLHHQREVVRGQLVIGMAGEQWCDRHNFAELYRRAIALRRAALAPANREIYYRFLLRWHKLGLAGQPLEEVLSRYSGCQLPLQVFERELLRSRLGSEQLPAALEAFEQMITRGELIVVARRTGDEGRRHLMFVPRGEGGTFLTKPALRETAERLDEAARAIHQFLQENGASLKRDLLIGTNLSSLQIENALSTLANLGLVSCDNYQSFLQCLQPAAATPEAGSSLPGLVPRPSWAARDRQRRPQPGFRRMLRERAAPLQQEGRWFLTSSFGVLGKESAHTERAARQARLLLYRHGILVKEWYRRENGLLPWPQLFHWLKRLEWQGEIRRGYFIEGLSGVQFALPAAIELLEELQTEKHANPLPAMLVSTIDPALPFGGAVEWNFTDASGGKIAVTRAPSNHLLLCEDQPVVYAENFASRLWRGAEWRADMAPALLQHLKAWLQLPVSLRPRPRLETLAIDGAPAAASELAQVFLQNGFEAEGEKLVLWPSAAQHA